MILSANEIPAIVLILIIVQLIKARTKISKRWLPIMALICGWVVVAPIIIWTEKAIPTCWVFISGVFFEGAKAAVWAIALYDIGWEALLNKGQFNLARMEGKECQKKFH